MYGIIHNSLKQLVKEKGGESAWLEITRAAKTQENFIDDRQYQDSETLGLIEAACKYLEMDLEECLEVFGEHWITRTADEVHGFLMNMTGATFLEFMKNVNGLHDRLSTAYPGYMAPVFKTLIENQDITVVYKSHRKGLAPLVRGMLKGLAARFGEKIIIKKEEDRSTDSYQETVFFLELS